MKQMKFVLAIHLLECTAICFGLFGMSKPLQLPFPNLVLPADAKHFETSITGISSQQAAKFIIDEALTVIKDIRGKPKSDLSVLDSMHNYFETKVVENREMLPSDYKFFGNDDNVGILERFLQTNPFYASTLTSTSGALPYQILCSSNTSLFYQFIDTLEDTYPRVDATFNEKLELQTITVYNDTTKAVIPKSKSEAAADLLLLVSFHASCVHAYIHVFTLIMVTCLGNCATVYPSLELWVEPYIRNIFIKYFETKLKYLDPNQGLTGRIFRVKHPNSNELMVIFRRLLCEWGSCKTANELIEKSLFKSVDLKKFKTAGHLNQFFKQSDLIHPFSTELTEVFKEAQPDQYTKLNEGIVTYLSKCNDGGVPISKVKDLTNWVELMSLTGIIHGCTYSLSRAFLTTTILKRLSLDPTHYTDLDAESAALIAPTLIGLIDGRHTFSGSLQQESLIQSIGNVKPLNPIARCVLCKYDAKSTELKLDYYRGLLKDPVTFKQFGWILTDFCPDGIDGKQLTIASYV